MNSKPYNWRELEKKFPEISEEKYNKRVAELNNIMSKMDMVFHSEEHGYLYWCNIGAAMNKSIHHTYVQRCISMNIWVIKHDTDDHFNETLKRLQVK